MAEAVGARSPRLRVVFVSHFVPYPPIGGAFQRSFHLLTRLAKRHEVHLVAIRHKSAVYETVAVDDAVEALRPHFASLQMVDLSRRTRPAQLATRAAWCLVSRQAFGVHLYDDATLRSTIHRVVHQVRPDILHLDTVGLAQYLDEAAGAASIIGHHNIESDMMARRALLEPHAVPRAYWHFEARQLAAYEQRSSPLADGHVVVSKDDAALLSRAAGRAAISVVSNGVDVEAIAPVRLASESRTLIFAGRQDQYANRDAILGFVRSTWPAIRHAVPGARLLIVGANPPPEVQALGGDGSGIEVTGFVTDVRPYFERSLAAVIPLRDGGGTRLKVLDAMALGMPIVSTTFGVGGLDLEPGQDLLIANDDDAWVAQISRLMSDPALQSQLAANARRVVERRFSWTTIADALSDAYASAVEARDRTRLAPPPDAAEPRRSA